MDISQSFLNFISKQTGVTHADVSEMSESEKKGNCVIYVSNYEYRRAIKYAKRIRTNRDKWYAVEIGYDEYCYWVAHSQIESFNRMNKIMQTTSEMNVDQMITDAMQRLKKNQAICEEIEKLPEEELVDEETFRKMMGEH